MKLLVVILNREEYLGSILPIFVELGVSEATILESKSVGYFLAYELPVFAGLRKLANGKKTASRIILAMIEESFALSKFMELLREEEIDFTKPDVGIVATLVVNEVIGPKRGDFLGSR
ncbi:MAG: hypothetical protein JRI96_12490 [Deltaproteobacteria bacterium]|nr:hypothetical protein [Deltaproteobacteria bacterium]